MVHEVLYYALYRLMALTFAAVVVARVLSVRDWKLQLAGGLVLLPLLLRALGGK